MGNRRASDNFNVLLFGYWSTFFIFPLAVFPDDLFQTSPKAGCSVSGSRCNGIIIYVTPNGTIYESERVWIDMVVTCFRANYLSIYIVKLISSMKKSWSRCLGCESI
jgi:hypothetical protein